jgi:methionine-rich copper-binding protein CopC
MARWGASAVSGRTVAAGVVAAGVALVALVALGALGLVLVAGPAGPAGAHARVAGSSPAAGEAVGRPPAEVSLELTAKPATVEGDPLMVYAPDGRRVDTGPARVSADRRRLTVALDTADELPAGGYQLVYRVVSSDTHVIHGRLTFSARAARAGSGAGPAADAPAGDLTVRRLGPAWTAEPGDAVLGAAPRARHLAAEPDDARPRAVAAGAAAMAVPALAWRMRPGRRRRRRAAATARTASARVRLAPAGVPETAADRGRRRVAAAQPRDARQARRPPGRRPSPAPVGSRGAPRTSPAAVAARRGPPAAPGARIGSGGAARRAG